MKKLKIKKEDPGNYLNLRNFFLRNKEEFIGFKDDKLKIVGIGSNRIQIKPIDIDGPGGSNIKYSVIVKRIKNDIELSKYHKFIADNFIEVIE